MNKLAVKPVPVTCEAIKNNGFTSQVTREVSLVFHSFSQVTGLDWR